MMSMQAGKCRMIIPDANPQFLEFRKRSKSGDESNSIMRCRAVRCLSFFPFPGGQANQMTCKEMIQI
jgi:hypothetical protein